MQRLLVRQLRLSLDARRLWKGFVHGVSPAPTHGQHNVAVYGELLGYSPQQIDQMAEDGLI